MANYSLSSSQVSLILQRLREHERNLRADIKYMSEYEEQTGEYVEWQSPTIQEDKDELEEVVNAIQALTGAGNA